VPQALGKEPESSSDPMRASLPLSPSLGHHSPLKKGGECVI